MIWETAGMTFLKRVCCNAISKILEGREETDMMERTYVRCDLKSFYAIVWSAWSGGWSATNLVMVDQRCTEKTICQPSLKAYCIFGQA